MRDAFVPPRRDAGPAAPTMDGVLDDPQWEDAVEETAAVVSDRTGSDLTRMLALIADDRLYLGIAVQLLTNDALIVYVDGEVGGPDGVTLGELTDDEGALDTVLSRMITVPTGFAPDVAFGTTVLPRAVSGVDDAAGWRDLIDAPDMFTALSSAEGELVCTATACEASIALADLPGTAPRDIAAFARIVAMGDTLTNQTLPEDDPVRPNVVMNLLTIADGVVIPDAGPVDGGGADAGAPGGIVVDGTVGAAEWAGAGMASNALSADGTPFMSNSLGTLRAVRTSSTLYVAIEGTLTSGNAILMYVDAEVGGVDGLVTLTGLSDFSGALDQAFSNKSLSAAALRLDYVWGTLDMSVVAMDFDARIGWRDIATDPANFSVPPVAQAPSACSADACEAAIPLSTLGARSGEPIGIFVRLGAATLDSFSNQTLPQDTAPELVTMYLEAL